MDLMKRLKTAFIIIIIVPVLMAIVTGKIIISYQLNSIQEMYNVESDSIQVIANPMQLLNRVTRSVFNKISLAAKKNPAALENLSYIEELNEELKEKNAYLLVRKGEEIVFNGNEKKSARIINLLPQFGDYDTNLDGGIYIGGKTPFLLKNQDFYYSDQSQGTIFVITDVTTLVPQIKSSAIQVVLAFINIIVITAALLILWLYRGILRPLNLLKKATKEIKEGNLDYSISGDPRDEIGQLCQNFEEMRIHLKELIEMKIQYEQDSRELISNISHDLKTPLTAIKGYAEGLIDGVADTPEKQQKYLKTIYTKANDMTGLVDELSFFSKIDCNTVPYNFSLIPVADYFEDCIEELSLDLEVKNIEIQYENTSNSSIRVLADAEQLKRVINNIIGNAVKYLGKDSGKISIQIIQIKDKIQIAITDNGVGIAKKDLPNIFERFYRADTSRNSKKGGSGLGLAIVKKIIEEHSGTVWAESTQGVGTTIYFTLPIYYDKKVIEKKVEQEDLKKSAKIKENKERRNIRRIKPWKKTEF